MKNRSARHWIVLALMCGLAGSSIGICNNTVGIFYTPVSESLGVLRGTFALQSTLSLMVTGVASLLLPSLMKKLTYKAILTAGVLAATLSTVAMAYSHNMALFYLWGVVRGVGAAAYASVPVTMIINNWFQEKHGLATSIALSFSGLASALFSPVLGWFVDNLGWSAAYLAQAALILLLALPAILFPYSLEPQSMGLLPYGAGQAPSSRPITELDAGGKTVRLLSVGFLCFAVLSVLHTSVTGIGQHLTGFAENVGFTATMGATMVSCAMIGNIGTKLAIGWLSDHFGPVKASVSMILLNVAALLALLLGGAVHSQALLFSAAVLYGSVYSVGAVGIALLTKHLFGMENYAAIYPKISLISSVGASLSLTLVGYVYDFTGSYAPALWGSVAIHAADLALLYLVWRGRRSKS